MCFQSKNQETFFSQLDKNPNYISLAIQFIICLKNYFQEAKMFLNQRNLMRQKNISKSPTTPNAIDLNVFKTITDLVDECTFEENLIELQKKLGVKKIDRDSQTFKDLKRYITVLLSYPNTSLAKLHRVSHRLGNFDKLSGQHTAKTITFQESKNLIDQLDNCPCCGLKKQNEQLKTLSTSFKDLQLVGISSYMLFRTMRNLFYFLILSLVVFGVFAFATNITCSNMWNDKDRPEKFTNTLLISLGAKIYLAMSGDYTDLLIWQVWLGLALVVLFIIGYVLMQWIEVTQIREVQYVTKSAADYSIVLRNVPNGITKEQVQAAINSIFAKSPTQGTQQNRNEFAIVKINNAIPIKVSKEIEKQNKQQLIKIQQTLKQYQQRIVSWVMELREGTSFRTPLQERRKIEEEFLANLKLKRQKEKQIIARVKQMYINETADTLTYCFVTFNSSKSKQKIIDSLSVSPFDKFFKYLTFNIYKKTVKMRFTKQGKEQEYSVQISQASEPEDIIWENIGMSTLSLFGRKLLTFFFTFLVLGMSFAAVYGLSTVQVQNQSNRYISFLISLIIVIFNFIIREVLKIFTAYELNSTYTDYQSSFAVKSIIAQLINTIVTPIIVNRFLKNQNYIYLSSGLADDIFLLGLTNAFVYPLYRIIRPSYFFKKYIRVWYYNRPAKKMSLNQLRFNKIYELLIFDNGVEYIYVISLYLWTCFFMSLQPIIIAFSILGYVINYWAQKHTLFHRCRRPVPGTRILYDTMVQFVYAGGFFYSLGSLTFINFIPLGVFGKQLNFTLAANIIAISISTLALFIPFSFLYSVYFDISKVQEDQIFENNRIFLPSEYDRLNPATSEQALKEYFQFVNNFKEQIRKRIQMNDQSLKGFFDILTHQGKQLFMRSSEEYNPLYQFQGFRKFAQLFHPKIQVVNPRAIYFYLIADAFEEIMNLKSIEQARLGLNAGQKTPVPEFRPRAREEKEEKKQEKQQTGVLAKLKDALMEKGEYFFGPNQQKQMQKQFYNQNQQSEDRFDRDHQELKQGGFYPQRDFNRKEIEKQNQQQIRRQQNLMERDQIQTLSQKIESQIVKLSDPRRNHLNYSSSPYNPYILEQFKQHANAIHLKDSFQSQSNPTYQRIDQVVNEALTNINKGNFRSIK